MVEQVLADYDLADGLKSVCLRYFNAAGADPMGGWRTPRPGNASDPFGVTGGVWST